MTADAELTAVETHVGTVELRRGGLGSNLVYLHSAVGEGEGLVLLDELASTFEVFAPVFPGWGESQGIEQIDDMEDVAFHLLDLFDRLHLDQPAVVGHSLGAWMAAELAVRYPDRLSALVLVNPVGLHIEGAPVRDIFGRKLDELAADFFADQSDPMAQMMTMMRDAEPGSLPFDMVRPLVQTMAATARLAWDPYLHNPKLHKRLWRITVPTLVVRGAQDTLVPAAHAEAYAAAVEGARLVEVDGAAHLLALEKPAELAALVREFVA
ncbi:MAG TPA: alpha/beta hydrolase [Acidimicrobiales bacterium]|jgi:pimeloyl-ACP methyl ester carboxylesterase